MAGLSETPTPNEVRKAFKKQSVREAVFEVIEETVEDTLVSGWTSSPVFQKYVEVKTLALGQTNKFYTKILALSLLLRLLMVITALRDRDLVLVRNSV